MEAGTVGVEENQAVQVFNCFFSVCVSGSGSGGLSEKQVETYAPEGPKVNAPTSY